MFGRIRRRVTRLARTANWRCADCDTWNDDADSKCCCCGN